MLQSQICPTHGAQDKEAESQQWVYTKKDKYEKRLRWRFKGKHKKLFSRADKMLLKILCSAEHFEEQQSRAETLTGNSLCSEGILSYPTPPALRKI